MLFKTCYRYCDKRMGDIMFEFKDYQRKGILYLLSKKKALLIMGCRTGKTATALCAGLLVASKNKGSVKVIAPVFTEKHWFKEFNRIRNYTRKFNTSLVFLSPFKKHLHKIEPNDVLIVDEVQLYMHDWFKHKTIINMAKKVNYCFMLTATPLTNNPINLYWPLRICGLDISKHNYIFKFMGGQRHKFDPSIVYPTKPTNRKELRELKEKYSYMFFRKENIKITNSFFGSAPVKPANTIENYSGMQKILGDAKALDKDILYWLDMFVKENSIIFFRHKSVGKKLKKYLRQKHNNIYYLDGERTIKERLKKLEEFKRDRGPKLLLLSLEIGGIGLDIKGTYDIYFFERTWNLSKDYQAYMRCYGFENDRPLNVTFLNYDDEAKYMVSKKKQILTTI